MSTSNSKKSISPIAATFSVLAATLIFSISIDGIWSVVGISQAQVSKGKVFVMYAASLIKTFEEIIGPAFQKETGYLYQGEARGSVQVANMIIDGLRKPDFFVSAGTIPIMKLMNNTSTSFAEWLVKFASAEMVISYSPNSRFYNDLEQARTGQIPWYKVLAKPGFKFGRTDPELDPKGYYMIIAAKLANLYYNDSGIKQKTLGDDRNTKQIFPEEILKTILEQGQLDAVASYKHESIARGLPYITLPAQINLGDSTFADFYRNASYIIESDDQTVFGEPIYFCFTIPTTVKNLDAAISFGNFILSTNGKSILQEEGLNPIKTIAEGNTAKIPSYLRNMIEEG
jgi:molybdate/tungstate transport system substrate-binding protein